MRQNSCGLMFIAACCSPHQAPSSGIPNREMYACAAGRTPLLGPEIREPYTHTCEQITTTTTTPQPCTTQHTPLCAAFSLGSQAAAQLAYQPHRPVLG